jgi:DNA-damage-inducible protein J
MQKNKAIQIRIDPSFKSEVEQIFSDLGITTSQAVSIFFKQVILNKGLPFKVELPKEPNQLTTQTLEQSLKKENLIEFESKEELFDSWDKL